MTDTDRASYESNPYPARTIISVFPSQETSTFFNHRYYLHEEFVNVDDPTALPPHFETHYSATLCYKCYNGLINKSEPLLPEFSIAKGFDYGNIDRLKRRSNNACRSH